MPGNTALNCKEQEVEAAGIVDLEVSTIGLGCTPA